MNYLFEMLTLLTGAYNRGDLQNVKKGRGLTTNIGKLFSLIADGFSLVQENAERVRLWDNLDNAEGTVLDRYGANFGVDRGAAGDALYRIMIRVKMIAQLSGGDDDTIIRASAELLGVEYSDIGLADVFPAKKALYVDQELLSDERLELIDQIAAAIKRILAAGIGLRLYLRVYHSYRQEILIGFGGAVGTHDTCPPCDVDRDDTFEVPVSYGAYIRANHMQAATAMSRTHITAKLIS